MIEINLLPKRLLRTRDNLRQQFLFVLLLFLCLAAAFYFMRRHLNEKTNRLRSALTDVEMEIKRNTKLIAKIDEIKEQLAIVKQKTSVIQRLEQNRLEPATLLVELADAVVAERMWLERFSDKGGINHISGIALDEKTVADFMTTLEKNPRFSEIRLSNIKKIKFDEGVDLKSFEIVSRKKSFPMGKTNTETSK